MLGALLIVHLAVICWWIGALYPLLVVLGRAPPELAAATIAAFGRRAAGIVLALVVAGALLLLALTGAEFDPASDYQQRFGCKLLLVAVLLALAAWNKLRLTPLLETDYAVGSRKLRRSIKGEMTAALLILGATAWIIAAKSASMKRSHRGKGPAGVVSAAAVSGVLAGRCRRTRAG